MNLRKILNEHKLAFERFAEVTNISIKTLRKYENDDESLKVSSRTKIETALNILDNCDIVWPEQYGFFNFYRKNIWWREVKDCNKAFKKVLAANGYAVK